MTVGGRIRMPRLASGRRNERGETGRERELCVFVYVFKIPRRHGNPLMGSR